MGLTDELKNLSDLHSSGALTDGEFADAKARLLTNAAPPPLPPPAPKKAKAKTRPIVVILLLSILMGFLFIVVRRSSPQQIASNPLLSGIAALAPIDLVDVVENLPANSLKGIPISLPYNGQLKIEIQILNGNPIDVYLVDPAQVQAIQNHQEFRYITGFEAQKTSAYSRQKRIPQGNYSLVLIDKTLGILSAQSSDIKIKTRLEP